MPKNTFDTQPVDQAIDGGHFAAMPKDISHVTFYFDLTPDDREDSEFFFVKIDTPDSVGDDLDAWHQQALDHIVARNAELAGAENIGVAIKFGSFKGGSGGEFYYATDGDSTDEDSCPTGAPIQAREFAANGGGVSYDYSDLFA